MHVQGASLKTVAVFPMVRLSNSPITVGADNVPRQVGTSLQHRTQFEALWSAHIRPLNSAFLAAALISSMPMNAYATVAEADELSAETEASAAYIDAPAPIPEVPAKLRQSLPYAVPGPAENPLTAPMNRPLGEAMRDMAARDRPDEPVDPLLAAALDYKPEPVERKPFIGSPLSIVFGALLSVLAVATIALYSLERRRGWKRLVLAAATAVTVSIALILSALGATQFETLPADKLAFLVGLTLIAGLLVLFIGLAALAFVTWVRSGFAADRHVKRDTPDRKSLQLNKMST